MSIKYFAPEYYKEFECIGSACEASCCDYPWQITVDKKHYKKIKNAFSESTTAKIKLDKFIKKIKKSNDLIVTDFVYATTTQDSKGRCSFLNSEKLEIK